MISSSRNDDEEALKKILLEPSAEVKALLDECADRQWIRQGRGRGRGRVVDGGDQEKKKELEEIEKGTERGKEKEKGRDRDESPLVTSRARTAHTNTREGKPSSCKFLSSHVSKQCTHTTKM